jgi:hypothetical protein
MPKIDFKKQLKSLYLPSSKQVVLVDVQPMNFLMIDGQGDPNASQDYKDAIEALYAVSYTLKFDIKNNTISTDYIVMPLESLWWAPGGSDFDLEHRDLWHWTAMIMQPPYVKAGRIEKAVRDAGKKKDLPALPKMRFENFHEGRSAQILHVGPFSKEGPAIARIHDFITSGGYKARGKHHEIYLSDFRKSGPEKLKTVIRQPLDMHP